MTLDEAIKHAEEVAEQNEWFEKNYLENKGCKECAEEHRQLAEWLKELKHLREQVSNLEKPNTEVLDKIRAEIAEYGSICVAYAITDKTKTDEGIEELVTDVLSEAKRQVLGIIDKYKASPTGVEGSE